MEQPTAQQPQYSTPSAPYKVSQNSSETEVSTVDVLAAKDLVVGLGSHYLDVRTTEEFEKGHADVEKAANIPYMFATPEGRVKNPKFLEQVSSLYRKEDHIVVGCQSGVRSLHAATDLLGAGFKDVKNMGGGYLAWVENGLATRKPEAATDEVAAEP
uniref:Rhodanese domain-containing protein n=1 Tax=Kalanchoe fedtschenkoi TaxID=63787 RepID=A0A7N1A174_KALFE